MKKLLALLLLFGVVGCASVVPTTNEIQSYADSNSIDNSLCIHILRKSTNQYPEYLECMRDIEKTAGSSASIKKKLPYEKASRGLRNIRAERLQYEKTPEGIEELAREYLLKADRNNNSLEQMEEDILREAEIKSKREKKILKELTDRCSGFGFTGDNNIAACVQREAQHDKEMAIQELELQRTRVALQKAQSQSYVQPAAEVKAEEDLHWTVKFLGNLAIGAVEGLTDPQLRNNRKQQEEINRLKKACKRSSSC